MPEATELNATYRTGHDDVTLTVIVGNGHRGNSVVYVGDREIPEDPEQHGRFRIGKGSEVVGKTMTVDSTVTRVQKKTDRTVITYVLEGGAEARREWRQAALAKKVGDSVDYAATFTLGS